VNSTGPVESSRSEANSVAVTVGGAIAFLLFAFIYFIEALHG